MGYEHETRPFGLFFLSSAPGCDVERRPNPPDACCVQPLSIDRQEDPLDDPQGEPPIR
jgi:hypothetical protein